MDSSATSDSFPNENASGSLGLLTETNELPPSSTTSASGGASIGGRSGGDRFTHDVFTDFRLHSPRVHSFSTF